MTFLRRKYKNAPRMWGPRSSVQAAVRENAEKIYGFDPDSVTIAIPVWDNQTSLIKNYPSIMNYGVVPDTDPVMTGIPVFEGYWSQAQNTDRIHIAKPLLEQNQGTYFFDFERRYAQTYLQSKYDAFLNIETTSNTSTHELFFGCWVDAPNFEFYPNVDQSVGVYHRFSSSTFPSEGTHRTIGMSWENGVALDGYRDGTPYGANTGGISWAASTWTNEYTYFHTGTSNYFARGRTYLQIGLTEPTTADQQALLTDHKYGLFLPIKRAYYSIPATATPTAVLTGTASDGATEWEIKAGGQQIVITLTDDTWVAAGSAFDAQRQNIIHGLNSAQSETLGWNNEVRDKLDVSAVVRTADTVVTITIG